MRIAPVFCLFILLSSSAATATPFEVETVDASNSVGTYASLAMDSHNNPHIAYYDATAQDLKYARKVGAVWMAEIVDSGNVTGLFASLALDANDAPHIAYYNGEVGLLRYAEKTSGSWITETVPDTGIYGSHCSITIAADGFPVVAYRDDFENNLSVAKKSGGGWGPLAGDGTPSTGYYTDIALDSDGFQYISHYIQSSGNLRLAYRTVGFTAVVTVDAGGGNDVGKYSSIALGADGSVHISYHDDTNGDLKYATTLTPNTFDTQVVDDGVLDDVGEWTSIALDASGQPRIAYYDVTNQQLKYASLRNATWNIETVDLSRVEHGQYASLGLDREGNPHMAYYAVDDQTLRYAGGAVKLLSPVGGETWAVGSLQEVIWFGAGEVDVRLATNGTDFDHLLVDDALASPAHVRVPHTPTRFARLQVLRFDSFASSTAASDSFFTIDASVILASLKATLDGDNVVLAWETQPGPEADIRYRVQRARTSGDFEALHAGLLEAGRFVDAGAPVGALYRVSAVNGIGHEILLGDVRALPEIAAGRLLTVTPNPIHGGGAMVLFRSPAAVAVQIHVYDVRGALVRTLYTLRSTSSTGWVRWDGADDRGARAHSGVYFVRLSSPAGLAATERVILVR